MEFYTLPSPAYPEDIREISLALWTDFPSAHDLRARLVAASTMPGDEGDRERAALDFAFLDGQSIASREHVLTAAHQAILGAAQGELRTQTVHSDIIDHLNPTSNVGEGLRRFGISSKSTSLLLVRIGRARDAKERQDLEQEMAALTGGKLVSLDSLEASADVAALKKIFKLGADAELDEGLIPTYTALNKTVGIF